MQDLTIRDLINMVVSGVPDASDKIQKVFEWKFERTRTIAQWILGASASLFVAAVAAFFRTGGLGDSNLPGFVKEAWFQIILFASPFIMSVPGIYLMINVRLLNRQFIEALLLHAQLSEIRTFIHLYRGQGDA